MFGFEKVTPQHPIAFGTHMEFPLALHSIIVSGHTFFVSSQLVKKMVVVIKNRVNKIFSFLRVKDVKKYPQTVIFHP